MNPDVSDFGARAAEQVAKVLKRQINWRSYYEAKLITKEELGLFQDYDKRSAEDQNDLLEDKGELYAALFCKSLSNVHVQETVDYILTLVDQFLQADPRKSKLFHQIATPQLNPYSPFLKILQRPTEQSYSNARAISILSVLLRNRPHPDSVPEVHEFLQYLIGKFVNERVEVKQQSLPKKGVVTDDKEKDKEKDKVVALEAVLTATKDMLKNSDNHPVFLAENGLLPLTQCLRKEGDNMQILYLGCFALWLMSFNKGNHAAFSEFEVVRRLVEILKKSIHRDKVIRICLATLKNLLTSSPFDEEMIAHGLVKIMQPIFTKTYKDDDIPKDAKAIDDVLEAKIAELSSWEKYRGEVLSGNLQWSPVHNELFFRENIQRFEDKGFEVVVSLISLLESKEPLTLEVACHDLGEFARFFPDGKRVVARYNGKTKIMVLMNNASAKVAKQALLAVQKMVVNNWEYLSKSTNMGAANTSVSTE